MQKHFVWAFGAGVMLSTGVILGCGGGGGGNDDDTATRSVRFHGEVEEGDLGKHVAGEGYVGYQVCTFGSCGTTDAAGEYSFTAVLPTSSIGAEVSVNGSEFSTVLGVQVPSNATDMDLEIVRDTERAQLVVAEVKVNGVVDESQGNDSFNDGD